MKRIFNISIFIFLLSVFSIPAGAQLIQKNQMGVVSSELSHNNQSAAVDFTLDLSRLDLDRNQSLTLTPVLVGTTNRMELPSILINGTTRQKVYSRSVALGGPEYSQNLPYSVIKLDKNSKSQVQYRQTIPYEKWMDTSFLELKEDFCGCGGHQQEIFTERIVDMPMPREPYMVQPRYAYIQPDIEEVKSRSEQWESYLDFPVNRTEIRPQYMNNSEELDKIETMLRTVRSDDNLTVNRIDITGFASPEGGVAHNEKLSKGRAEAFKKYLVSRVDFPESAYYVEYGGENWEGLERAVEKSNIDGKTEILNILRNTGVVATRKKQLQTLNKGVPYRHMLKEIYPKLRKVVSKAIYTVRGFDVNEAKEIVKTRPQQLSLNEMYLVANTYPVGSRDYSNIFETAVVMFPEDKVANLNAASVALSQNNLEKARKHLDKADSNSPQYANNLGVFYMLQGDWDKARTELTRAARAGSKEAEYNIQELDKKIKSDSSDR